MFSERMTARRRAGWRRGAMGMLAGLALALALLPGTGRSVAARLPQPDRTGKLEVVFTYSGHWHAESDAVPPPYQMATRKWVFDANWEIEYSNRLYTPLTPTVLRQIAHTWPSMDLHLPGHWISGKATMRVVDLRPGVSCTQIYQRVPATDLGVPAIIGVLGAKEPREGAAGVPLPTELVVAIGLDLFQPHPDPRHFTYCDSPRTEWSAAGHTTWGEHIPFDAATDRIDKYEDFIDGRDWNNLAYREVNAVFTIPLNAIVETAHAFWRSHLGKSGPNPPMTAYDNAWQATLQVSTRPLLGH